MIFKHYREPYFVLPVNRHWRWYVYKRDMWRMVGTSLTISCLCFVIWFMPTIILFKFHHGCKEPFVLSCHPEYIIYASTWGEMIHALHFWGCCALGISMLAQWCKHNRFCGFIRGGGE